LLVGTKKYELEDYAWANFYCLHAFAECSLCIRIREKTLEFSLVLPTFVSLHT